MSIWPPVLCCSHHTIHGTLKGVFACLNNKMNAAHGEIAIRFQGLALQYVVLPTHQPKRPGQTHWPVLVCMKAFTLVSTVFNEIKRLDQTIADIDAQSWQPDQIIITDAGSTDGTLERLERWKDTSKVDIVVLHKPKCNISEGRNLAIETSRNELIVSTDFGCRFHPDWLRSLVEPFEDDAIEVVGGAFTIIREDVKSQSARADYILANAYPVVLDEYFSVSSRSISYYRYVWKAIGGYLEWLTLAADDTIFWRMIKNKKFRSKLVEQPYVYWLRHKSFKAFGKEAYRYGLGDGESLINYKNFWSNLIETGLRWSLWLHLPLIPFYLSSGHVLPLILLPIQLFGLRSYKNAWKNWKNLQAEGYGIKDLLAAFWLVEVTRFYYLNGFLQGWIFSPPFRKVARKKLEPLPV